MKNLSLILLTIGVLLGGYTLVSKEKSLGGYDQPFIKSVTPLNAVTATDTSEAIDVLGAKRVTFILSSDIFGTGTTTFDVDASIDGVNFVDYNKLVENVANTNVQGLTRIASKAFTATSTGYMLSMDLEDDLIKEFKVTATISGDVTDATAKTLIQF